MLNEDGEFTQDAKTQLNTHINGSTVLRTFHPGGNNDFDKINEALLNPSIDNVMGVYMNEKSTGEACDIAAGYQLATNQQPKMYSYRHEQEKCSESQQYGLSLLNTKEEHLNEHLKTFFRKHKFECLLMADKKGCKNVVKGLVKALREEHKIAGPPIEDISATILASILNGFLEEKSLILAARIGHAEVVSALVKLDADAVNRPTKESDPALIVAAEKGHTKTVEALLNARANVNVTSQYGSTALILAAYRGHTEMVTTLLKVPDINVNHANNTGDTALSLAVDKGHTETVALLLDRGAAIAASPYLWVTFPNKWGYTVLGRAAIRGHTETVALLLENGAAIEATDKSGNTALILAADRGHTETVEALLNAGANVNVTNKYGDTALHLVAALSDRTKTVALLLENGAAIEATDKSGNTALILAADRGHTETVEALLNAGANVNVTNKYGDTALHLVAALSDRTKTVALLLERGAAIDATNYNRNTALILAAEKGHTGTVALLLEKGAAIDATDYNCNTALLRAANRGHAETVALLLEKGGAIDATNKWGDTALRAAKSHNHTEVAKIIKEQTAKMFSDKLEQMVEHTQMVEPTYEHTNEAARTLNNLIRDFNNDDLGLIIHQMEKNGLAHNHKAIELVINTAKTLCFQHFSTAPLKKLAKQLLKIGSTNPVYVPPKNESQKGNSPRS